MNYLADPELVVLLPGVAEAIRLLSLAGIPSVVCTNQSGIARGLITLEQARAVRLQVTRLLEAEGVVLLDSFVCPHHEEFTGPCACRKPGTLLFEQAAALHHLDLARSVFVGDKHRDLAPVTRFGATGYLIRSDATPDADLAAASRDACVAVGSLLEAVQQFLRRGS